jgi:hypothetical protein
MVSFVGPQPTPSISGWLSVMLRELCTCLEDLERLRILSWEIANYARDPQVILEPLLSIRLLHLESLRIMSLSIGDEPRPPGQLLYAKFQATLPSLKYLEFFYSEYKAFGGAEAAAFESRKQAVHYMQAFLLSLLDKSPAMESQLHDQSSS